MGGPRTPVPRRPDRRVRQRLHRDRDLHDSHEPGWSQGSRQEAVLVGRSLIDPRRRDGPRALVRMAPARPHPPDDEQHGGHDDHDDGLRQRDRVARLRRRAARLFLAVSVLVTILALTYLLRRPGSAYEGDRDDEPGGPDVRRKATAAVQTAIQELELGGDVRQVILACFERFCRLLGARGITEQVALTPRELERLAIVRLRVSPDASDTLTSLFEEARYSEHALGEADRVRAIDSLAGIRAALGA